MSGSSSLDYTEHFEKAAREQEGMERLVFDLTARQSGVVLYPFGKRECDHGIANHLECGQCSWLELSPMLNDGGVIGDLALDHLMEEAGR